MWEQGQECNSDDTSCGSALQRRPFWGVMHVWGFSPLSSTEQVRTDMDRKGRKNKTNTDTHAHENMYNYLMTRRDASVFLSLLRFDPHILYGLFICDISYCPSCKKKKKTVCATWHKKPLGACFILFLPPESCCQQVASLHPFSVFLCRLSQRTLALMKAGAFATPLIELGIPQRKVAALLMKG